MSIASRFSDDKALQKKCNKSDVRCGRKENMQRNHKTITEAATKIAERGGGLRLDQSRFLGRGCDEALFSEKKGFSVKRGEAIQ